MNERWIRCALLACLLSLAGAMSAAAGEETQAKYDGEYLRFVYRTETDGGLAETITTEIVPGSDGQFRVVTTTEQVTGADQIRLGFFGGSFHWLGLYTGEQEGDRFDLSSLDALASQDLEPQKRYLLPDGGLLQTGDRVTVAGVPGIEGVFTHASAEGVTIAVVLADDRMLRQLLPFPLQVQVSYEEPGDAEMEGVDEVWEPGTICLVALTRTPEDGGTP